MTTILSGRRTVTAGIAAVCILFSGIALAGEPSPAMQNQAQALANLCRADFMKLCANVMPGGGRGLACLEAHAQLLSPPCAAAIPTAQKLKTQAEQAGVMPK
jgi:hypothetical protein